MYVAGLSVSSSSRTEVAIPQEGAPFEAGRSMTCGASIVILREITFSVSPDMDEHDCLRAIRRDYTLGALNDEGLPDSPFEMFKVWFDEAMKTQPFEPNACSLATSGADGRPTCRMVLLKGIDESG